jgi:MFS family permease
MTRRDIFALGIGQCINWGVLYYAFGVLLGPVARELSLPRWIVAGAFSTALLTSAVAAPAVGRWSDRGQGPMVMTAGGFLAAALLGAWALLPGVAVLYAAWAALGLCMAATLYEPAFIIVGRALPVPRDRLRALATVTVFGGLASTVFLPLTALLIQARGWRFAAGALAGAMLLSAQSSARLPLRAAPPGDPAPARAGGAGDAAARTRQFRTTLQVFSLTALASAAFTTTMVPAFIERGLPPTLSASLGGLLGLMQLPGRAFLMSGWLEMSPARLLMGSLALQAAGFAVLSVVRSPAAVGAGVSLFAIGAGLMTVLRPQLVQTGFGIDRAGFLNGRLARAGQLARAAGPVLAVALAGVAGHGAVFLALSAMLVVLAAAWHLRGPAFG